MMFGMWFTQYLCIFWGINFNTPPMHSLNFDRWPNHTQPRKRDTIKCSCIRIWHRQKVWSWKTIKIVFCSKKGRSGDANQEIYLDSPESQKRSFLPCPWCMEHAAGSTTSVRQHSSPLLYAYGCVAGHCSIVSVEVKLKIFA